MQTRGCEAVSRRRSDSGEAELVSIACNHFPLPLSPAFSLNLLVSPFNSALLSASAGYGEPLQASNADQYPFHKRPHGHGLRRLLVGKKAPAREYNNLRHSVRQIQTRPPLSRLPAPPPRGACCCPCDCVAPTQVVRFTTAGRGTASRPNNQDIGHRPSRRD